MERKWLAFFYAEVDTPFIPFVHMNNEIAAGEAGKAGFVLDVNRGIGLAVEGKGGV